jgi:hypothetical protein
MADNEDKQKPAGNRPGGRPGRTPVTIDLPAERVSEAAGAAASAGPAKAAPPPLETGPAAGIRPSDTIQGAPGAGAEAASGSRSTAESPKRTDPEEMPHRGGPMSGEPAPGAVRASPPADPKPSERPPVAPARSPAGAHSGEAKPETRRGYGLMSVVGIALVAAILALAIGYGLQAAGILSAPGNAVSDEELRAVRQEVEALRSQIAQVPATPDLGPLEGRIAAVEAGAVDAGEIEARLAALSERLDALPPPPAPADTGRIDDLAAAVASLRQQIAAQSAAGNPEEAQQFAAALAAIEQRLGDLEATRVAPETTEQIAGLADRATALTTEVRALSGRVAIGSLRSAADRGEPFAAEVAMLRQLGADATALATLEEAADSGIPTREALARDFRAVADAILEATGGVDPDAGFFARLWANASSLVTVRPVGPVEGDDPPAVVSRMRAAADDGDLAAALAEREGLPDSGRAASAEWAAAAAKRVALDGEIAALAASLAPAGDAPAQ